MPSFCECGSDRIVCQVCGRVFCSGDRPDVKCSKTLTSEWIKGLGNVCTPCLPDVSKMEVKG